MCARKPLKILLVEDSQQVAETIFDYFEGDGHHLDYAANGTLGLQLALQYDYDCIILDVMLPGVDGIEICSKLRESGVATPIIMLTARDTQQDMLQGLNGGADDYIIKPFDLSLLEARIHAVVRRVRGDGFKKIINVGSLQIDLKQRLVTRNESVLRLNPSCYKILLLLAQQSPRPVSRESLEVALWQDEVPDQDLLRRHMYQLRKIIDKAFDAEMLVTVPKFGYKLISDENT
ncbi:MULTISPECIES: response regulator transcription factor [Pseudoalteromonas]|uniref:response regulator transcription factor n=1 Tax=Pseudoalteromonas TaxID=53246 RepID=UPI0005FA4F95|nr:response regulator transcription factor [Pseudoalteromonas piscicida]KJZ04972.1 chemotaxis protein CheY [Pseudoalteromonas piscicida]